MTREIHIQGTGTDPARRAQRMLEERGDELLAELAVKVALVADLHLRLGDREEARETLIAFCTRQLVRHLLATDRVLYSVAAGAAETRLLVRALRAQHDLVAARIAELTRADSSAEVAASAHALVGLLEVCHHVERQVLIPALAVLPGVDLSALADDVETFARRQRAEHPGGARRSRDPARPQASAHLRHLRATGTRRVLRPGQQPRPEAVAARVPGHLSRRVRVGLPRGRPGPVAGSDRAAPRGGLRCGRRAAQPNERLFHREPYVPGVAVSLRRSMRFS